MCGFTSSNYPQLQTLHEKYNKQGLSIAAFPSNEFGGQEPKPEPEIKEFIKKFNVGFDMYSKVRVNSDEAHPLFKFLRHKQNSVLGDFIKWNFTKFLVNRQGEPVRRYAPTTAPKDIEKDIVQLLNEKQSKL
jgi:glutathione peroxidase-family protein